MDKRAVSRDHINPDPLRFHSPSVPPSQNSVFNVQSSHASSSSSSSTANETTVKSVPNGGLSNLSNLSDSSSSSSSSPSESSSSTVSYTVHPHSTFTCLSAAYRPGHTLLSAFDQDVYSIVLSFYAQLLSGYRRFLFFIDGVPFFNANSFLSRFADLN
jgi:hypothetical protein